MAVEPIESVAALDRITSRHPASIAVVLFYRTDVTNNITCLNRYYEMANSARARMIAGGRRPVFFAVHDLHTGDGQLQDRYGGPDLPLCVFFIGQNDPVQKISGMDMILVLETVERYARGGH